MKTSINILADSITAHWPALQEKYKVDSEFQLNQLPMLYEAIQAERFKLHPHINYTGDISSFAQFTVYWQHPGNQELYPIDAVQAIAKQQKQIYDELLYLVVVDVIKYVEEQLP